MLDVDCALFLRSETVVVAFRPPAPHIVGVNGGGPAHPALLSLSADSTLEGSGLLMKSGIGAGILDCALPRGMLGVYPASGMADIYDLQLHAALSHVRLIGPRADALEDCKDLAWSFGVLEDGKVGDDSNGDALMIL